MNVSILSKDQNWLDTCWTAIRTCKSAKTPTELMKDAKEKPEADKVRLLKACFTAGHLSVFEHVKVTFAVEGVSRALLAQITRHRIGVSFSVQSQRYVKMGDLEMVVPEAIRNNAEAEDAFEAFMVDAGVAYSFLLACGVPAEDARFVTPGGACTNFVTTLNLRALLDVYLKRVRAKGAQWEIRQMVERMAELVMEAEPWTKALFD